MTKRNKLFLSIIWLCIFSYTFSFAGNAHAIAGFFTALDESHNINFTKQNNEINFILNHHNHENEAAPANNEHKHNKAFNKAYSISTSEKGHLDHKIKLIHFNQLFSSSAKNLEFKRFAFSTIEVMKPHFITQISNNNIYPVLRINPSNFSFSTTVLLI